MFYFKIWMAIAGILFIAGCVIAARLKQNTGEEYLKFKDRRKGVGALTGILVTICLFVGCNSCWNHMDDQDKPNNTVSDTATIKFKVVDNQNNQSKEIEPENKIDPGKSLANIDAGEMLADTDIRFKRIKFLLERASLLYKEPMDSVAEKTYKLHSMLHEKGVAVSNQEILEYVKGFGKMKGVDYNNVMQLYYIYKLQ